MLTNQLTQINFNIDNVASCDFSELDSLDNEAVLRHIGKKASERLVGFVEANMGIDHRYWCKPDQDALTLARSALQRLVDCDPGVLEEAEFLIYCGISNPYPVTTLSALLGGEFGFKNASCWDLKSGCSTALLALQQALGCIKAGAKKGVIVAAENLSRFSNPEILQMAMAIGDGAVALTVSDKPCWQVKSSVHGTDASYSSYMRVQGGFPCDADDYSREDYYFSFGNKPEGIAMLGHYWQSSLKELLERAELTGKQVQHYIAHQVDESKNLDIARSAGIDDQRVALNFRQYGNMGCPTVFINYLQWLNSSASEFKPDDHLVFHAVGGGISWAGICARHL